MDRARAEELNNWIANWIGTYLRNSAYFGVSMHPHKLNVGKWYVKIQLMGYPDHKITIRVNDIDWKQCAEWLEGEDTWIDSARSEDMQ